MEKSMQYKDLSWVSWAQTTTGLHNNYEKSKK